MKILIICTGNSCRSQMAAGILKSFNPDLQVYSAGTEPASRVNPNAIAVMNEIGIDISTATPKSVIKYINQSFDYVITVCDTAKESCPFFTGDVKKRIHIGFDDPALATGEPEEILDEYRRVRDEIFSGFKDFYRTIKH